MPNPYSSSRASGGASSGNDVTMSSANGSRNGNAASYVRAEKNDNNMMVDNPSSSSSTGMSNNNGGYGSASHHHHSHGSHSYGSSYGSSSNSNNAKATTTGGSAKSHQQQQQQQPTSSSASISRPGTGGDQHSTAKRRSTQQSAGASQHYGSSSAQVSVPTSNLMSSHLDSYLQVASNSSTENEINGYKIGRILGRGSYAKVCLAEAPEGRTVAVKIIDKDAAPENFVRRFLPREISILSHLDHNNVIRTEAMMRFHRKIYIFMEYCENGDLLHYMQARGALPEPEAQKKFHQIVLGVHYLHEQNIAHRDLKCENILIAKNHRLVIGDFGFARPCGPLGGGPCEKVWSQTFCGSVAYAAPEVIQGERYDPRMYDCWSIGVILFILVCGSMPFDDSNIRKMIRKQKQKRFAFPSEVERRLSAEAKDLVSKCMEPDVNLRLSTAEMFAHYWLADQEKVGEVFGDEFERSTMKLARVSTRRA